MLRIDERERGDGTVLQLEGKLMGGWIAELRGAVAPTPPHRVRLDLSGVSFMDGEGVSLLIELSRRGVRMINCSPFAEAQLRQVGIGCEVE